MGIRWRLAVVRSLFILLTALLLGVLLAGPLAAQTPAVTTLVKAGRLLDPKTGNVLSPAAVLIENGKIKEVGSPLQLQARALAGSKTIDLGGATPPNAYCAARSWHAKTWKVVSRRCAMWGTPALMGTWCCAMQSTPAASPVHEYSPPLAS